MGTCLIGQLWMNIEASHSAHHVLTCTPHDLCRKHTECTSILGFVLPRHGSCWRLGFSEFSGRSRAAGRAWIGAGA